MGVQGFQDYIEKHCPSAVVPVELQKLARGSLVGGGRQRPPQTPLRLLVDADNCLHRLYGGFYTDWVSGGQWNHMLGYLAALAKACFGGNIELFVFFNGALEKARLHEWVKRQGNERQTAQQIVSHVQNKGTPPPKVWFLPPVCMAHCIRLALIRFHVKVRPGAGGGVGGTRCVGRGGARVVRTASPCPLRCPLCRGARGLRRAGLEWARRAGARWMDVRSFGPRTVEVRPQRRPSLVAGLLYSGPSDVGAMPEGWWRARTRSLGWRCRRGQCLPFWRRRAGYPTGPVFSSSESHPFFPSNRLMSEAWRRNSNSGEKRLEIVPPRQPGEVTLVPRPLVPRPWPLIRKAGPCTRVL